MNKVKGFTLIELSIVIVIIGLIVAGIVGGQAIVQQSKIRAQISDLKKYKLATNAFYLEYNATPGDFRSASSYWGGSSNGNGNGKIDGALDGATDPNSESLLFFNHLSLSEIIPETYDNSSTLGAGYPILKIAAGKGMTAGNHYGGNASGLQVTNQFQFKLGLVLQIGQPDEPSNIDRNDDTGTASPVTYSMIDKKIDDGIALQGTFREYRVWASRYGQCLATVDGDYLLTNSAPSSHGVYIMKF